MPGKGFSGIGLQFDYISCETGRVRDGNPRRTDGSPEAEDGSPAAGRQKTIILKNLEDYIMALVRTQNWLPSIFNDFFDDEWLPRTTRRAGVPAVNIIENEKNYRIELAAPGMSKEDLKVSINEDNELVIAFEKQSGNGNGDEKKEQKGTYLRREFSYTSFRQSFTLPDDVDRDKIEAGMEHGVLTVDLPKKDMTQETPASRQIEIR